MSFLAKLQVDGEEYNMLRCSFDFDQPMSATGKPAGRPQGGRIIATIEDNGGFNLLHWMASPDQMKDGTVTYYKRDAMSRLRQVVFKKAFCVKLTSLFEATGPAPLQMRIIISARSLHIGDMNFENPWGE